MMTRVLHELFNLLHIPTILSNRSLAFVTASPLGALIYTVLNLAEVSVLSKPFDSSICMRLSKPFDRICPLDEITCPLADSGRTSSTLHFYHFFLEVEMVANKLPPLKNQFRLSCLSNEKLVFLSFALSFRHNHPYKF